ncbi:MAG: nucleotide exchange factor GrpE [Cytophagales bacterium]|nr:nucleotide exchange factor GrpE [Cytophagales bacterium]
MDQEVKDQNEELENELTEAAEEEQEETTASAETEAEEEEEEEDIEVKLSREVAEAKDKYLRLYSEFENFRRRTAKEKLDIINTASRELMVDLLPVLDDFERALKSLKDNEDGEKASEGMELISNKFHNTLKNKGLKVIEVNAGDEFNDEFHEAITQIPAPSEDLAGKIVDVVEKGYFLNDKVIRFAKVVTGAKG